MIQFVSNYNKYIETKNKDKVNEKIKIKNNKNSNKFLKLGPMGPHFYQEYYKYYKIHIK